MKLLFTTLLILLFSTSTFGCYDESSDRKINFIYCKSLAENGDAEAQHDIAIMFSKGDGTEKSSDNAIEWHLKSAIQGYMESQNELGRILLYGSGSTKKDISQAIMWFERAAAHNHINAMIILGMIYQNKVNIGDNSLLNYKQSLEWYLKAANLGDHDAQYFIGETYEEGIGIDQNLHLAYKWYKKSAGQGNPGALIKLGSMYARGVVVKEDDSKAHELFKQAATLGDAEGQYRTGLSYMLGSGVQRSYAEAYKWLLKAKDNGFKESNGALDKLDRLMQNKPNFSAS